MKLGTESSQRRETELENASASCWRDNRRKGVKELVVRLLALQKPLSARQVFQELNDGPNPPSYQAVHKALSILLSQGVLNRSRLGYELNPQWLKFLAEFAASASSRTSRMQGPDVMPIF